MDTFTDSKFMSAEEKAKVLRAWERFLKGGCQKEQFSKALYHHLMQHCGFIAHYDLNGFYGTYFEHGDDTVRFLSQFDIRNAELSQPGGEIVLMPQNVEYGSRQWYTADYDDVNKAMIQVGVKYIPRLIEEAVKKGIAHDLNVAKRLVEKHGLQMRVLIPGKEK
jgi:hypothetical protein